MESPIKKKQRLRLEMLKKCYEVSDGSERKIIDMWSIGKSLGMSHKETKDVTRYLSGESLVECRALGGKISITHWGIKEVEQAILNPNESTEHFLPINFLKIDTVIDSQIQQGTVQSTQNQKINSFDYQELKEILKTVKDCLKSEDLEKTQKGEIEGDIRSIEGQLSKNKPNEDLIRECLHSIRSVFEGVVGNATFQMGSQSISSFLGGI